MDSRTYEKLSRDSVLETLHQFQYVVERRQEQRHDNDVRIGTMSRGTTIGVDYVYARKHIAEMIYRSIIPNPNKSARTHLALNENGVYIVNKLLTIGVTRATITAWLYKYANWSEKLYIPRRRQ